MHQFSAKGCLWAVQSNYQPAFEKIEQHEIEGKNGEIEETYYYMQDHEQVEELSDRLNQHLEIKHPMIARNVSTSSERDSSSSPTHHIVRAISLLKLVQILHDHESE